MSVLAAFSIPDAILRSLLLMPTICLKESGAVASGILGGPFRIAPVASARFQRTVYLNGTDRRN